MREKRPQNAVTATQLRCQSTIMSSVTSCVVMSSAVDTAIPAGRKQRRGGGGVHAQHNVGLTRVCVAPSIMTRRLHYCLFKPPYRRRFRS